MLTCGYILKDHLNSSSAKLDITHKQNTEFIEFIESIEYLGLDIAIGCVSYDKGTIQEAKSGISSIII